jgi:O-antigen ligase
VAFLRQSAFAVGLFVAIALAAAFLAPASAAVLHGVVLLASGLMLMAFRPTSTLRKPVWISALAFLLASLLAFLPTSWTGTPAWRAHLAESGGIAMGALATPQPLQAITGVVLLAVGVGTGLFLLTLSLSHRARLNLAAAFSLGVAAYAAVAWYASFRGWIYPGTADLGHQFGFFPNKNHTASFLLLGAFASLGALAELLRRGRWTSAAAVAAGACITFAALLIGCDSRAGAPLFLVGFSIWLVAGVGFRRVRPRVFVGCWIAAIIAATLFVSFDSHSRTRLGQLISHVTGPTSEPDSTQAGASPLLESEHSWDFRVLIWKDTLAMIREQPLTGVGLGNFRYVFPQFRSASRIELLCIHPESTLLQLAAEAGLPAVAALLFLLGASFSRLRLHRGDGSWLGRSAFGIGAMMFLLHCCVDVPGTRVSTLWPAMLLAALAVSPDSNSNARPPAVAVRMLFFVLGLGEALAGVWLLSQTRSQKAAFYGPDAVSQAHTAVYNLYAAGDIGAATRAAQQGIARAPLDPEFYFQEGTLQMTHLHTESIVDRLYRSERLVEPINPSTPIREAGVWMLIDPGRAVELLPDALQRASHLRPSPSGTTTREDVYRDFLRMSGTSQSARAKVAEFAAGDDELTLLWLDSGSSQEVDTGIEQILAMDPALRGWSLAQQRRLFRTWRSRGTLSRLQAALDRAPQLANADWFLRAEDLAGKGAYEAACALARKYIPLPPVPTSDSMADHTLEIGLLKSRFEDSPSQYSAQKLAEAYFSAADFDEVQSLARDPATRNASSPQLFALAYEAAVEARDWPSAWGWIHQFAGMSDPSVWPR